MGVFIGDVTIQILDTQRGVTHEELTWLCRMLGILIPGGILQLYVNVLSEFQYSEPITDETHGRLREGRYDLLVDATEIRKLLKKG